MPFRRRKPSPLWPPRPILLIHGSDDAVTPVESATRLQMAVGPAAELWVLPGRGHTEGVRTRTRLREAIATARGLFTTGPRSFSRVRSRRGPRNAKELRCHVGSRRSTLKPPYNQAQLRWR